MRIPRSLTALSLALAAFQTGAQTAAPAPDSPAPSALRTPEDARFWGYFDREFNRHSAIQWSLEPKEFGTFTNPENQLLVPDGFKPGAQALPVVVVVPTCGGTKASTRERMKEFLAAGYGVLTVESYKPRFTPNCRANVVTPPVVFKDTFDALAALQTVPWVAKDRIFQVGYSMGAFAAAWVSSPSNALNTQSKSRFRASVGHYGNCSFQFAPHTLSLPFLRKDIDQALLMIMADGDTETPMASCFPLLEELKAANKPVSWHVFNGPTHAWDQQESNGYTFTNGWGKQVAYRYDQATTLEATRRTLEFLGQFK